MVFYSGLPPKVAVIMSPDRDPCLYGEKKLLINGLRPYFRRKTISCLSNICRHQPDVSYDSKATDKDDFKIWARAFNRFSRSGYGPSKVSFQLFPPRFRMQLH